MSTPFEGIADLDRVVHEPARLAILSALSACASADFVFLQRITGLSKGNLGAHLSKLEEAGLISTVKEFVGRMPRTTVTLTDDGRVRVETYWRELERLSRAVRRWRPA
jgi:DNA-binding transcriptional ArsR family regulator